MEDEEVKPIPEHVAGEQVVVEEVKPIAENVIGENVVVAHSINVQGDFNLRGPAQEGTSNSNTDNVNSLGRVDNIWVNSGG